MIDVIRHALRLNKARRLRDAAFSRLHDGDRVQAKILFAKARLAETGDRAPLMLAELNQ